jgi:hypothetical protein
MGLWGSLKKAAGAVGDFVEDAAEWTGGAVEDAAEWTAEAAKDAGGWVVDTVKDADCLVWKTNPICWQTVAGLYAARAAGIIKNPNDCANLTQKGTKWAAAYHIPESWSKSFGDCACKQVFGATGKVTQSAEAVNSSQVALSATKAASQYLLLGPQVSVVSRSADKLDVFAVSRVQGVQTAAWQAGDVPWRGWWPIAGGKSLPGAPVGVVSRSKDLLDVFLVGLDGGIYTAAWQPGDTAWRGWWPVAGGKSLPGGTVTGVSRAKDKLDIFVVGTDGNIYTAAWQAGYKA